MIEEKQYERIAQALPFLWRDEPRGRGELFVQAHPARGPAGHRALCWGQRGRGHAPPPSRG